MEQLKFGDINSLLKVYRSKPHLMENEHECDCEYCDYDGINYECSVCGYDHDDDDIFGIEGEYECPGCGVKLLSETELNDLIELKRKSYTK